MMHRRIRLLAVDASMIFLALTVRDVTQMDSIRHEQLEVPAVSYVESCNLRVEYEPECKEDEEPESGENTLAISEADQDILLKVSMAEAEGESTEGKALVMRVVLNRVANDEFPDSIEEVVMEENQFSVTREDGRFYTVVPSEDCHLALEMVLHGWDESQGALYFESENKAGWHSRNLEYLFPLGGHRFYR